MMIVCSMQYAADRFQEAAVGTFRETSRMAEVKVLRVISWHPFG